MECKRYNVLNIALMFVIIFSLIMIGFEEISMSGRATLETSSNVSIVSYLAIDFSDDLASGIIFEDVLFLPANNINAKGNYNGSMNSTNYFVQVSPDGNTPIDLCIRANSGMRTSGGDEIPLSGETYSSSFENNLTNPSIFDETSLALNYSVLSSAVPSGNRSFMRFWLDVPSNQPAGQYNNSIFFKGIASGVGC